MDCFTVIQMEGSLMKDGLSVQHPNMGHFWGKNSVISIENPNF
jgi:hypothetical protein